MSSVTLKQRLSNRIDDLRGGKSKESFEDDPYVRLAFQSLDLNLNDTEDRALVLRALGWELQGGRLLRPAGFLNDLVIDAQKLVDEGLTGGKQEAVRRLKSDGRYRHKYKKYTTHTLLKYLAHAIKRDKIQISTSWRTCIRTDPYLSGTAEDILGHGYGTGHRASRRRVMRRACRLAKRETLPTLIKIGGLLNDAFANL